MSVREKQRRKQIQERAEQKRKAQLDAEWELEKNNQFLKVEENPGVSATLSAAEKSLHTVKGFIDSGQQALGATVTGLSIAEARTNRKEARNSMAILESDSISESNPDSSDSQNPLLNQSNSNPVNPNNKNLYQRTKLKAYKYRNETEWCDDRRDKLLRLAILMICVFVVLLAMGGMALISWRTHGHWYSHQPAHGISF